MNNQQLIMGDKYKISPQYINKLKRIIAEHVYDDTITPLHHEKKVFSAFSKPIKAVVFDIYGTLIHSAAGDINTQSSLTKDKFEVAELDICIPFEDVRALLQTYVMEAHINSKKEKGILYPEIDAIDMWKTISKNNIFPQPIDNDEHAALCAVYYEIYNNPSCPMPNAIAVLEHLHKKGILLGVISNAQFYTPLFLDAMFSTHDIWQTLRFPVQIWSYQLLEAKPSQRLFSLALDEFSYLGIAPDEIVYVGNDKRNDIAPPLALNMGTVLYAGDTVSYRPRLDDPQIASISPHRIISSLYDILEFI